MRTGSTASSAAPYHYVELLFDGRIPTMEAIERSLAYLGQSRDQRCPCCAASAVLTWKKNPAAQHARAGHPRLRPVRVS